jgi:small subunit ribosomal protein S6
MLNIDGSPESLKEYERLLGLHEDIVRFLTIKIDKVDENPSPLMNNKPDRQRTEISTQNTKSDVSA